MAFYAAVDPHGGPSIVRPLSQPLTQSTLLMLYRLRIIRCTGLWRCGIDRYNFLLHYPSGWVS